MRCPRRLAALTGAAMALLVVGTTVAPAATAAGPAPQLLPPKADILVDAGTGAVLVGDNIHGKIRPASTAKIMTALAAVERIPPNAIISAYPRTDSLESTKIGFPATAKWPLDMMLASMFMMSANDAAYAVANTVGHGNLATFTADVNATARQLGLRDSTFNDPAGLDDRTSFQGGPVTSVYDLAIATRNAMSVPEIAKYAGLREYSFVDPAGVHHHYTNHNKMLPGSSYAYAGATGFKTGYTDLAGHSLVVTATRNGRTLIAVLLGAPDLGYAEAAALLDAGFATPANSEGTGVTLPAVAVSLYASRSADQLAFAHLGQASPSAATDPTLGSSVPVFDQAPRVAPPPAPTAHSASAATHGGDHGFSPFHLFNVRIVLVLVILMAGATFFLRRRAVRRRRAQRLARQRQRNAAMRSGGLPVVDGRYRAGLRLGPPVESYVRVRPFDDRGEGAG